MLTTREHAAEVCVCFYSFPLTYLTRIKVCRRGIKPTFFTQTETSPWCAFDPGLKPSTSLFVFLLVVWGTSQCLVFVPPINTLLPLGASVLPTWRWVQISTHLQSKRFLLIIFHNLLLKIGNNVWVLGLCRSWLLSFLCTRVSFLSSLLMQSYWSSGLYPSSGILNNRQHNVSKTGSTSIFRWR